MRLAWVSAAFIDGELADKMWSVCYLDSLCSCILMRFLLPRCSFWSTLDVVTDIH